MPAHHDGDGTPFDPEQWTFRKSELEQPLLGNLWTSIQQHIRSGDVRMSYTFVPGPAWPPPVIRTSRKKAYQDGPQPTGSRRTATRERAHAAANRPKENLEVDLTSGPGLQNPFEPGTRASTNWLRRYGRSGGGGRAPIERLVEHWLGWGRDTIAEVLEISISEAK